MKLFFLKLFLLLSISFSQTLIINVFDKETSIPLEGANIIIKKEFDNVNEIFGNSSDQYGISIINNIQLGQYEVLISFIGYKEYRSKIVLDEIKNYEITALLIRESITGPELNIIGGINSSYQSLPGSATVINENVIRQISPIGTQEILENVAGIHAFSDDGIGNSRISIGIRGLNPRRSSRVLILEDGIPIQPALYVYPNMYYNPPVERIDGIQVIKGSGVIKYGPQTMGGVVNYYTRRPSEKFSGFTNLSLGENNYKSIFFELNGLGSNNIKNAFQFLYKSGDGFRDNNNFEQYNGTFKTNYNLSNRKNLYSKLSMNYENSQATYTGLTEYSFGQNPKFNPKEDDNFKVFRISLDFIETTKISNNLTQIKKVFGSYFDRHWWRETDIFTLDSDMNEQFDGVDFWNLYNYNDIIRTGNSETNFGIIRTFYVLGYEQLYRFNNLLINNSKTELGLRTYWERFIDDKLIGNSANAREGIMFYEAESYTDTNGNHSYDDGEDFLDLNGNNEYDDTETIIGQSHHYETAALSGFISNQFGLGSISINSGLRFELFEQERIDLLDGASYLDNTTFVILPSFSFIKSFEKFSLFGGIHRGYTAPSSGALKVSNIVLETGLDLKAEKSWNKELGMRINNHLMNLEFSYFHIDINNLVAAGRGTAFKNLGKVKTNGTELAAELKLSDISLFIPTIHFVHTYLNTKIIEGELEKYYFMGTGDPISLVGNSLPYAPENNFILGLEFNLFNNLNMRIDYKYVDEVYTDFHNISKSDIANNNGWDKIARLGIMGPIDSYSIINGNISYIISEKITINIIGKNLADKIFIGSRLHSNPNQPQADISSGIIPGPRRQINFSIKYSL